MNEAKIANYTDIKHIQDEVTNSIQLFKKNKWPIIDVTRKSVGNRGINNKDIGNQTEVKNDHISIQK